MPFCPYCPREFTRISALQNHSAFCAIQHQSKYAATNSEQELEVPPIRDIYIVLQKLVSENNKLKKRIATLERRHEQEKKKVPLINWLNANKTPNMIFDDWVNNIKVTHNDFNYVINTTCADGVMEIIKRHLICDVPPICSFDQKLKTLFIFVQKSWRIIEIDEFNRFIDNIVLKVGKQFNIWIEDNDAELKKDDINLYLYTKKIYGQDTDIVAKKIHLRLYNYIKYNLRKVVEYEFSF